MNSLRVDENGMKEVEINTISDTKIQFNDLIIQYIEESNIIVISYDTIPASVLFVYSVIQRGKPASFKCYHNGYRLEVCEPINMELA